MTTGVLALIILGVVLLQVALASSISIYRRRNRLSESPPLPSRGPDETGPQRPSSSTASAETPTADAWQGYREFRIEERRYENTDKSICSFYLAPVDDQALPAFKPGQYLTFKLAINATSDREPSHLQRCYSLSDRPHQPRYRISVKRACAPPSHPDAPPGVVSNYFHDHLRCGDRLMVKAPAGHFYLHEDSALPLVLIGGGVGITPMMSMLNTLLAAGSERRIWLFYGVRDGNELIMGEHLRTLSRDHENFQLHLCFSRPNEWEREGVDFHHRGRVDIPLLQDNLKLGRYQFYICGPSTMMESLVLGLEALGIDGADIHHESFGPSTLRRPRTADAERDDDRQPSIVTFSKSGKQVRWQRESGSILELAETEGIDVESGCRAGCCGGCSTRIESGEVEYSQDPEADIEPGSCLLCIASPKGDITLSA
jgi:ferredoxin-NADP reductase